MNSQSMSSQNEVGNGAGQVGGNGVMVGWTGFQEAYRKSGGSLVSLFM